MEIKEHEEKILEFWNSDDIFKKSLKKTEKGKPYIFYDGPPFATGLPHYGHLLGSVVKDLFGRFWTMQGRYVRRVWGWDCHGLPIENIAEKGLGINSKDEIETMGVCKFNSFCQNKVLGYANDWKKIINRLGRWVDMDTCYKTMDNSYIESVWWAFKQLYEKGFIYEGEKILMYCPRCSTPLAKAEIAMDNSYKEVEDLTVVVKFKLKDPQIENKKGVYAIAWTTTPWTLPSNLALAINPKFDYAYILDKDENIYLLAKSLVKDFFKEDYKIIKEVKGKELEGQKFEPLFDYFKEHQNAFQFILGDFVTAEDGTGIVHTAPNFGEEDYEVCKKYGIKIIDSVDEKGNFKEVIKDFSGEYVHDTNKKVIDFLKEQEKVVFVKKMKHEYPFCYRCDTKLIYRAIPAWFVNIQKIKPRLLELNKKLNWYPKFLKEGRVKYTIETAPDWNISRNRYWATAIPIWKAEDGELLVIGSVEDLKKYAKKLPKGEINLHKDFLDEIVLEKEGKEFKRIPEVLDCWFESGAMTFAQFHYPFENKEFFEKNFPAQFVAEYIGQVRAWFYYMNVLSAILFDDIPFENIVTTGTILAEDGEKMSKSKQNFTDPMILVNKFGVDALRFYLMNCPVMNADNLNFSDKQVEEIYKKVILLLYNVNRFYEDYKIDEEVKKVNSKEITDKWIIARLNQAGEKIGNYFKEYNTIKSTDEIRQFVDDLSTWYVRLNRERFNRGDKDAIKTLKFVLDNFSKIIAPVIPFVSEKIYQNLYSNADSVHLQLWPEFKKIDVELLNEMERVREIVSQGLKQRDQNKIGLKWPLGKAKMNLISPISKEAQEIIKEQLNVKELDFEIANSKVEKGFGVEVSLDTAMNKELEAEGYSREVARQVQAYRKELGLNKEDLVNVSFVVEKDLKEMFEKNLDFLIQRINAKKIEFVTTTTKERFINKKDFIIKDKKGVIVIDY